MKKRCLAWILAVLLLAGCVSEGQGTGSTGETGQTSSTVSEIEATDPSQSLPTGGESSGPEEAEEGILLFAGGSRCVSMPSDLERNYSVLAAYWDKVSAENPNAAVLLVDGGDTLAMEEIGLPDEGQNVVSLMNAAGFSLAVPGEHDLDHGLEALLAAAEAGKFEYTACNFIDLTTGKTVFAPYVLRTVGGFQVAFVGICSARTPEKALFADFTDGQGNPLYSFCQGEDGQELYDCVQGAIDDAKNAGADVVICLGHTGMDVVDTPYTSVDIIENTTGMLAYLDGHAVSVVESDTVKDKDGNTVTLCASGSQPGDLTEIHLNLKDKQVRVNAVSGLTDEDPAVAVTSRKAEERVEAWKKRSAGRSEGELLLEGSLTGETSLGKFCAEAYRSVMGADIALISGSDLSGELDQGTVTYGELLSLLPGNRCLTVVEITGSRLVDVLEMAVMGGDTPFLHVAGLTYEVDDSIPTGVLLDGNGDFVEIHGRRRVSNVRIDGVTISRSKTYTLAGTSDLLCYGQDGYTMLESCPVVQDGGTTNRQALLWYLEEILGGVIPVE